MEQPDDASTERWVRILRATLWRYFRPTVIGAENVPAGRGLIVGCHSGVIPYDAACLFVVINDAAQAAGAGARRPVFIGDRLWFRIPAVGRFLEREGVVLGRPDLLEQALRDERVVLEFPGGALDMTRPYLTQRYRVLPHRGFAPGRGGYIKVALRTSSPIVPLAVVGAEETHVLLGNVGPLARVTGIPIAPLLLFPLPLPAKLYLRFGRPIELPGTPEDAEDQRKVDRWNDMVRRRVQRLIDDTVRRRHGIIVSHYEGTAAPSRKAG